MGRRGHLKIERVGPVTEMLYRRCVVDYELREIIEREVADAIKNGEAGR